MSFNSADTSSLSNLSGSQTNTNLYDPDRAYMQKLMAYEMYGNQGVTGSEYNPFNTGPQSNAAKRQDWTAPAPDWQHGSGHTPDSPLTPIDTLPPPTGNPQDWNGNSWQDPPTGGDDGSGRGGNPFGGYRPVTGTIDRPVVGGPAQVPRDTHTVFRQPGDNNPSQHLGDLGTSTNPIQTQGYVPGTDPNAGVHDPRASRPMVQTDAQGNPIAGPPLQRPVTPFAGA